MSTPPDLGPLPRPFVPGDEHNPRDYFIADQMRDFGQRCYMLGVAAERERCARLVEAWPRGAGPHSTLPNAMRDPISAAPSEPTKEGG